MAFALLFVVSAFATGLSAKPSGNEERTVLLTVVDAVAVSPVSFEETPVYVFTANSASVASTVPDKKAEIYAVVLKNTEFGKITPVNLPLDQRIRGKDQRLFINTILNEKPNRPDPLSPRPSKYRRTGNESSYLTAYKSHFKDLIVSPDNIPRRC